MFDASDHSFVVCAYEESPYLRECVESLMAQTTRTHVAIATATPNKHIAAIASEFGLPLHVNSAQPGIGSDWNYAVSCATTPLVTLAHQDDVYLPCYAERMLASMSRTERPLIFFSDYGEIRPEGIVDHDALLAAKRRLLRPFVRRQGISADRRIKRSALSFGNAISCPSVTLHLPLLPSPPFRTQMGSNLDWDAWERFSCLDGSFVYANEILMRHRIHEESTTSALIRDNTRTTEDLAMLERFWPRPVACLLNLAYSRGQSSNG